MFFNGFFAVFLVGSLVARIEAFLLANEKIGVEPGPSVLATKGEVWPKPQLRVTNEEFFVIRPNSFQFKVVGKTCDILEKALQRYKQDLKAHEKIRRTIKDHSSNKERRRRNRMSDESFRGYLDELSVNLASPCEYMPHMNMDEHYEIRVNTEDLPQNASLVSQSIWGVLRGLETWSQLIYISSDKNALIINSTSIMDFPRYPHRGLLIDTSRHYLPLRIIYSVLDGMVMNKMNVLHWHIVDDQSFPFQSKAYPDLSEKGAYSPAHVYTAQDVQAVIGYATSRGIRVLPEFDTPGHTRSWGEGHPEILTTCYSHGQPDGTLGPMNPIIPDTYKFMKKFLREIKETFPDSYIHLGGDEVDFACWESNPDIQDYMEHQKITPKQLEESYVNQVIEMATNLSATPIVWQEVFDNGVKISKETVVHVWKGNFPSELYDVTSKGYQALLSSCWYLDDVRSGGDWLKFYRCDPDVFSGDDRQKRLILGGEACMWGEVVDSNNILSRVWPRASATAEKLWSPRGSADIRNASGRLEEHTCRMNRRKIPAQPPNGPGFCLESNFS